MNPEELKEHRDRLDSLLNTKLRQLSETANPNLAEHLRVQINALRDRIEELS